jgi:hypothetical protein
MSVDPTPTSDHLARNSKEAVRAGTRTRFNLWVLLIGLALVIAGFAWIWTSNVDELGSTREDIGVTRQDGQAFDTTIQPAKGDSPVDGESVNPANANTTPSQENPAAQ